jgi:hypothetical protein
MCLPLVPFADAATYYVKLRVDDGLTWEVAKERRDAVRDELVSRNATPVRLRRVGPGGGAALFVSTSWCITYATILWLVVFAK